MIRFLRFAVERSLEGRGAELKEYLLGVEIFDRSVAFDPRVDPIVRVEARRLRSKLRAYYSADGHDDAVIIELPTGTYAPRFRFRARQPQPEPPPAEDSFRDIAVLPFTNLSPDPDSEYFSDGLTEELIHALTKVVGLRVVAWGTAVKLRERQGDLESIGGQLKVSRVLMGSLRKWGNRVRIMARLVDPRAGYCLWSETYNRKIEDLFTIQEEISRAIVGSLRLNLFGSPAPARRATPNMEAYDLYLRGRFHWNKRTPDGLERALQYFARSIAIDPQFASGHAGLADVYSLRADYGLSMPADVMPQAKAAATRALELDPELAESHASLGLILALNEWKWEEAGKHYQRAIELNPGYVTAHHWFGCDYLAMLGRMDQAIAEMELAYRLDPLSPVIAESLAYVYMLARRYDESLEKHLEAQELDPYFYKSYTGLGRLYIHMGMYDEAIQMLHRGHALAGDMPSILGALGQAHAMAGRPGDARAALLCLSELAKTRFVASATFALIHAGLGENGRALDCLENSAHRREFSVCAIGVHPGYDALRGEPRFEALLRQIGLK